MIKAYIGRAMMVSMMEEDQLDRLQKKEYEVKYLLPNWNIQELFNLPTIKDRYSIPEDSLEQIVHNKRIAEEIDRLKLKSTGEIFDDRMEWVHAFDRNVMAAKGNIVWDFSGSSPRKGNLKEMLRVVLIAALSMQVISFSY